MKAYYVDVDNGEYFLMLLTNHDKEPQEVSGPFNSAKEAWGMAEKVALPQGGIYTCMPDEFRHILIAREVSPTRAAWIVK